jgi:hypothetical protein
MRSEFMAKAEAAVEELVGMIERGEPATAPGLPPGFPAPEKLVTEDCIQPRTQA